MVFRFGPGRAFSIEVGARELFASLPGRVEVYLWWERCSSFRLWRARGAMDLDLGRLRLCVARSRP